MTIKKKITIALGILLMLIIIGVIGLSVYRSSESYRARKASETTGESMKISIDGVLYVDTGMEMPVEPEEISIEYVEIPVGGDHADMITAFAKIHEGNEDYLVCLVNEEWFKFVAE